MRLLQYEYEPRSFNGDSIKGAVVRVRRLVTRQCVRRSRDRSSNISFFLLLLLLPVLRRQSRSFRRLLDLRGELHVVNEIPSHSFLPFYPFLAKHPSACSTMEILVKRSEDP